MVCCRDEGGQLEEDNARITSEIEQKKAGIEEAKARLQYYEGHQREVTHKVRCLLFSTMCSRVSRCTVTNMVWLSGVTLISNLLPRCGLAKV